MGTYAIMAALIIVNAVAANYLGWLLTEWKRPLFNFKPFSCRPCLTFWLTLAMGAAIIYLCGSAVVAAAVLSTALTNYFIIKSKIKTYE